MSAITFNAIKYVDRLVAKGVDEQQAKEQIIILQEVVDETLKGELATKSDLLSVEAKLKTEIAVLFNKLVITMIAVAGIGLTFIKLFF